MDEVRRRFYYDGGLRYRERFLAGHHGWIEAGSLVPFSYNTKGYPRVAIKREHFQAHRVVWALHHGDPYPLGLDHRDGDPSNCVIENLRFATDCENLHNCISSRGPLPPGVSVDHKSRGKGFKAQITYEGKWTYLGRFSTAEQAHAAYVAAKDALAGEYSPYRRDE